MAGTIVGRLVGFNRSLCNRLGERFPRAFIRGGGYHGKLMERISDVLCRKDNIRVLEAGGIDRPLLRKAVGIRYDGLDIDQTPLCDEIYDHFSRRSIEDPVEGTYDLIISSALMEHVADTDKAFRNIYHALADGVTIHYVPSKYHPYSLSLRIVGHRLQRRIINHLRPWAASVTGYPAYFDNCSPGQMERMLRRIGYRDIEILPFYRANDYFSFFVPVYILVSFWENMCRRLNARMFCSGFIVVAAKKSNTGGR